MLARLFTYSSESRFVPRVIAATLLMCGLAAAPAFAQANAGNANIQIVDCSQVQTAVVQQYNNGDAVAVSQYGDAIAVIAQALDISQSQVNNCLGGTTPETTTSETTTPETTTSETTSPETRTSESTTAETTTAPNSSVGAVNNPNDVVPGTIAKGELVNTGGLPLTVAAAGLALMAVGIMRSIIRRGR